MAVGTIAALPVNTHLTPEQIRALDAGRLHRVERICGRMGVTPFRPTDPVQVAVETACAAVAGTAAVPPERLLTVMAERVAHLMPAWSPPFELGLALGIALAIASEPEA